MNKEFENYMARLRAGISEVTDLSQIPIWLERNTSHPADSTKPWSFKGHEYQIEIVKDKAHDVCSRKCSQVGFSEIMARLALALLSIQKNFTLIYILPTTSFASKFSKGRIDPIIETSSYLKSAMKSDVNSSELKQLSNSFLYCFGTYGKSSGISVPAQGLFKDEVDFCNQEVLTKFNSRLRHAGDRRIMRQFSTPTVSGFGIDAEFERSSKAYYTVRCNNCHEQVAPDFLNDVEIPGFQDSLHFFEKEDLANKSVDVEKAFVRCPDCRKPIDWRQFLNPDMRVWVHSRPSVAYHGYQVLPWDVPTVNPLHKSILEIAEYERKKDWVNFVIGYPYEDAEISFVASVIDSFTSGGAASAPDGVDSVVNVTNGTFMGVDVGKTSWVTIGKPTTIDGQQVLKVIYRERVRQDGDNYLLKRLLFLEKCFGVSHAVIDAGPDFSTSQAFVEHGGIANNWACYYVKQSKNSLESFKLDEGERIVKAGRTERFNILVKAVNSGAVRFSEGSEQELVKSHLTSMKRVDYRNEHGDDISNWISTDDDHYAHSVNYLLLAYHLSDKSVAGDDVIPVLPGITRVKMKEPEPKDVDMTLGRFYGKGIANKKLR